MSAALALITMATAAAIGAIVAAIMFDAPRVSHVEASGIEFVTTMTACDAVECRRD